MEKSDLLVEHGTNPFTQKYEGHYMYPELSALKRLRLYEATHYLMGILVPDLSIYVAKYSLTTLPGAAFTSEAARVYERLAGGPVDSVLTPEVANLLRAELDNLIERILIRDELYYVSPLKRGL